MPANTRKHMDQIIDRAQRQGFVATKTANDHWQVRAPDGEGLVHVPSAPSYGRSFENSIAQLRTIGVDPDDNGNGSNGDRHGDDRDEITEVYGCRWSDCPRRFETRDDRHAHERDDHRIDQTIEEKRAMTDREPTRHTRYDVLSAMRTRNVGEAWSRSELLEALGAGDDYSNALGAHLTVLIKSDEVERVRRGVYRLTSRGAAAVAPSRPIEFTGALPPSETETATTGEKPATATAPAAPAAAPESPQVGTLLEVVARGDRRVVAIDEHGVAWIATPF